MNSILLHVSRTIHHYIKMKIILYSKALSLHSCCWELNLSSYPTRHSTQLNSPSSSPSYARKTRHDAVQIRDGGQPGGPTTVILAILCLLLQPRFFFVLWLLLLGLLRRRPGPAAPPPPPPSPPWQGSDVSARWPAPHLHHHRACRLREILCSNVSCP